MNEGYWTAIALLSLGIALVALALRVAARK